MSATSVAGTAELLDLEQGSHVCWVVADRDAFEPIASAILSRAAETKEKIFSFGPVGSAHQSLFQGLGAVTADPFADFLGKRGLEPDTMFSMFREQTRLAKAEGYAGLRLVADMDWMLPIGAPAEDAVAFELMLDRVVQELGATVVCAYHEKSFTPDALEGVAAVHPVVAGVEPQFQIVAEPFGWALSGEIDFSVAAKFSCALETALTTGPKTVDLTRLRFIDCAGMRVLAKAIAAHGDDTVLRGAPGTIRRAWESAGFDSVAALGA